MSCKDLTELNSDTKNPEEVSSGSLFANATVELFDFMASTNVNRNTLRFWAQYWTATTYPDESNYELTERDANGFVYVVLYTRVLRDIKEARAVMQEDQFLTDENKRNQSAVMSVLEVYAYHLLVDIFGDVPYDEALTPGEVTPAYEAGSSIYDKIIAKLDGAISDLSGESAFGADDLVYGGDVSLWRKAANTLKLRMAMRIADVNASKSQTMAEAAVSDGVFASNGESLMLNYESSFPNTNPLWEDLVQSGRNDFVLGNTLVDHMNTLNDPRRDDFMTCPCDSNGNYVGGIVGASNAYPDYSHITPTLLDPTYPGIILDYTEVEFLLADAAQRGYNVGGTAEDHYNTAVTESILYWGGTQQEADDYLQNDAPYDAANWKESIGMQHWIAMYNRGFEGWSGWRLYDAPMLNEAAEALTTPPLRFIYPVDEFSLNGENVQKASDKYGDNDPFSPVFWDVN